MTQKERSNSLESVGRRMVNGVGILTITSSVMASHYFSSNPESNAQLKLSKALSKDPRSSLFVDVEEWESRSRLLGYEVDDLKIGFPVGASFENSEGFGEKSTEDEIENFIALELSKVFQVSLFEFQRQFSSEISYLKLIGTEGETGIPFVIVSPLDGGETFSFMVMDISKKNKLQIPGHDNDVAGSVLIPLDRVISPYNHVNTLDAVGGGESRQTLMRYIEGYGWVFISPFNDFKPAQDLRINYNSLKEGCVLFGC